MIGPLLLLLLAAAAPPRAPAPFTVVESGRGFARLADAVDSLGGGDGTIRIAPGRYRDCAVQEGGRVAFVAAVPGAAIFDGGICEGKATLVLRGLASRVEGLVFTHARVEDGNGAGIRIETGDLLVRSTRFVDAQCGILSAADPKGVVTVERSSFAGLGRHPDGDGAHSLYIGRYGALRILNSRFERGTGGHYVKSRAPRVEIIGTSFDDSRGRDTNYMIDLPNGAVGRIANNIFLQGKGKENWSALIAVTAERKLYPAAGLLIEDNQASLAPGARPAAFVADWSHEPLTLRGNRLGRGIHRYERRLRLP